MTAILNPKSSETLSLVKETLLREEPVALPTETVYGLAAPITSERALKRIFELKQRPFSDPLILHVLDQDHVEPWAELSFDLEKRLMDLYWPGPLTLVLKKKKVTPDLVTSGHPTLAVRSPQNEVFRKVLAFVETPLCAPSANLFQSISPTSALDVVEELGPQGLEFVVDGEESSLGLESCILQVTSEKEIVVLRHGSLSLEKIQQDLPEVAIVDKASEKVATPIVPGQEDKHYSPRKNFCVMNEEDSIEEFRALFPGQRGALLVFSGQKAPDSLEGVDVHVLEGTQEDWARGFYRKLRELDKNSDYDFLCAYFLKNPKGLALSLNDRLRRAANKGFSSSR